MQQAGQDQRRNVAAVFVLVDADNERIAGYYTLSASEVALEALPEAARRRLPQYSNVPTALLGRLAVDETYRGRSLGRLLLADALRQIVVLQAHIATWGVTVAAMDDNARAFYEHFGFSRIPDEPYHLFLPLDSIKKTVTAEDMEFGLANVRTYNVPL